MNQQTATARTTGVWYLGLAVTGLLGFLVIRPAIWVDGDPAATLAHLNEREGLARLGVGLEMGIVVTQALAAIWFYKLYRSVHHVAGVAVALFGIVNAVAIMANAVFMATALAVAGDSSLAPSGDAVATVGLLHHLSSTAWGVGALFFGLWLIPMGWAAITSQRFPAALGWTLVVGGAGYIVSAGVEYALVDAPSRLVDGLTLPASIGEFWMIGYLLMRGIRSQPTATKPSPRTSVAAPL